MTDSAEASLKRLEEAQGWTDGRGVPLDNVFVVADDLRTILTAYRAQAALLEGEQEAYARGFNAGFEESAEQLSALQSDNDTLRAALEGTSRSGVYVASRASVLERGAMWRRYRDAGAPIISTWIDEDGPNDTADLDELWVRIRREVTSAERLILYVESDDFPLKGAFVEIGMALAANVPIYVIAPDVEISGRNQRPFGSWIKHPSVTFCATVDEALSRRGRG